MSEVNKYQIMQVFRGRDRARSQVSWLILSLVLVSWMSFFFFPSPALKRITESFHDRQPNVCKRTQCDDSQHSHTR